MCVENRARVRKLYNKQIQQFSELLKVLQYAKIYYNL
jgi:hypothetical protein